MKHDYYSPPDDVGFDDEAAAGRYATGAGFGLRLTQAGWIAARPDTPFDFRLAQKDGGRWYWVAER